MKKIFKVVLALLVVIYPIAVYFGLQKFEAKFIALGLCMLVILRALFSPSFAGIKSKHLIIASTAIGVGIAGFSFLNNTDLGIRLYPVLMSFLFLIVFLLSLFNPPTIIERFARAQDPGLSEEGVVYCRKVTLIWCSFFLINICISAYTVFFSSLEIWSLYNGFLSYFLMGILFVGEYIYRKLILKQ
ncbi:MAG: hypothetical protein HWD86_07000 [Kangiellaceae bacterium]|nr:hypothetical protein [Kangiellaceae bacterium]